MEFGDFGLTRFLLQRALAVVYLIAFLVAANQFRALLGERGLLPVPEWMRRHGWRVAPSLFQLRYSDRLALACAWAGVGLSVFALTGFSEQFGTPVSMAVWFLLWALYLSFVNMGQTWYAFGWETLLLEAGFLAIFLGGAGTETPEVVIWLYRWVLFRVMFGAGLIKLRGDPCWRDLTCLFYHYETQPL
ncbi:MAG: lipase maturation factor family protein, partial [Gemmatimonadota bacterium]